MDPKRRPALDREYVDFEADIQSAQEEDCETLVVHVPGFRKEQLRLQLTTTRTLIISGERPLQDNKWSRFRNEWPVSTNCDTDRITAKFDGDILYIRQPKLITPAALKQDKEKLKLDSEAQKTDNIRDHAGDQETASSSSMADDQYYKQTEEKRLSSKSMDAEGFAEGAAERKKIDADNVFKKSQEEEEEKSNGIAKDGERTIKTNMKMAMMKPGRRLINLVLLVLLALVIGIYVKNWINKPGD